MPLPVLNAVRWATLTLAFLLAATMPAPARTAYGAALLAHLLWRTARPGRGHESNVVATAVEVTLHLIVVGATGGWRSPFVVTLVGPILAISRARAVQRSAEEREVNALSQLARLTEANELLLALSRVARTLPASLDLNDAIEATLAQVRELHPANVIALLLCNRASATWTVAGTVGLRLPSSIRDSDIPPTLAAAIGGNCAQLIDDLRAANTGISERSACGVYAPLRARGELVGVLAVERSIPGALVDRDRELLEGIAEQAAMAIENARWFAALRRIGAEEERLRIAHDLHDRVGQTLAYTSFELDRISRSAPPEIAEELQTLRSDTREVLAQVRETLSDVRADVAEDRDLVQTVEAYVDRVRRRSDIEIAFEYGGRGRLPLSVEREMWRITQEAIANVERHAGATHVDINWRCDDRTAVIEVIDDGEGIAPERLGAAGSLGLVGMRERADAIGARLEISSALGAGTTVRCAIEAA